MGVLKKIKNIPNIRCRDIRAYWLNEGPKVIFIILYIIANFIVIAERVIWYTVVETDPYDIMGMGVVLARSSAAAIKLNCAMILIPVLRNFLSFIRGTCIGSYLPIDKAIVFHIRIAMAIAFFALIHISAHFINFNTVEHYDDEEELDDKVGLESRSAYLILVTTIAGITGLVTTFCMIFMYTSSLKSVRGPNFEAFWYTHHLFILFYVSNCIHGAGAILEFPTFWCWVILPLLAYLIERIIRICRGSTKTILHEVIQHPSRVIELQMRKANFKYQAGQYIFLNCPYLSRREWHPFTISSAPEESFLGVHIRVAGDWTGALVELLNPQKKLGKVASNILTADDGSPIVKVDGPFGTSASDIFKFETVMLIAAGIGVTPYASILKTIRYQIEAQLQAAEEGESIVVKSPIKKVYFYWANRDQTAFEWFFELLSALEDDNVNNFLEINIFLTAARTAEDLERMKSEEGDADYAAAGRDPITGLKSGTNYGRPKFDQIFDSVAKTHDGGRVGVFFCGPRGLSKMLSKFAKKATKKTNTKFKYHKENF